MTWFFGSLYISRLSDNIFHNEVRVIFNWSYCTLAIAALALIAHNYFLLVVSRGIMWLVHGCTAGVQPIAAAAMIDFAKTDHDRSRCFGFIAFGMCLGLVFYPMITGPFSY